MSIGDVTGTLVGSVTGELVGSVFTHDSTPLLDGVKKDLGDIETGRQWLVIPTHGMTQWWCW